MRSDIDDSSLLVAVRIQSRFLFQIKASEKFKIHILRGVLGDAGRYNNHVGDGVPFGVRPSRVTIYVTSYKVT